MKTGKQTLTAQQRDAIFTRDVSIALSAGAGCGKTFVLTERFLSHLDPSQGPDPLAHLVAITFTDRAAREMRDRIRSACHQALAGSLPEQVDHWMRILRGLDAARISTIHSFCAGLLRAHAVEAGIDPRFAVLEADEASAQLRRAVRDSVLELLSDRDEDCMQLVLDYNLERTQEILKCLVRGRFQIDTDEFDGMTVEGLFDRWQAFHRQRFAARRLDRFVESRVVRRTLDVLGANEPSNPIMQSRRALLLDILPRIAGMARERVPLDELQGAARVQGGGGEKAWRSVDVYNDVKVALEKFRDELKGLSSDLTLDKQSLSRAATSTVRALRLAVKASVSYDALKQSLGALDFDDLLLLTRNLLRDSREVRERASAGIDFLLIDEFQDTDPVQSDVVRMLCGEDMFAGRLFLVGDVKQSIYRFRRADPHVFEQLRAEIPEQGRLPLSVNFRSQPAVLNFVNCLIGPTMGPTYEPLVPFVKQLSPTPAVEFLFAQADPPVPDETAEDRRIREADWIARRLRDLLDDPTPRIRTVDPATKAVSLRPVLPGDVAILFRALSNVAHYEEALRRRGLEYYLVGGRAFFAQQEVYDLVNLCQYLDDEDDEASLVGVLRSPLFSLSDDAVFALAENAGHAGVQRTNLTAALAAEPPPHLPEDQQRLLRHAGEVLADLRANKDRIPLARLISRAVERTGYDASLLHEFLGRRKLANLRKIVEMARQFDRGGMTTLKDFVVRLRESIAEAAHEELAPIHSETSDVMRLMSIHQAKGLEFPVVVVADMCWRPPGNYQAAHFHRELGPLLPPAARRPQGEKNPALEMFRFLEAAEDDAETVRLLYVALTRAADMLILSGAPEDGGQQSPWMRLLSERFDLDTGQPQLDPFLGKLSIGNVPPEVIPKIRVHKVPPDVDKSPARRDVKEIALSQLEAAVMAAEPAPLPDTLDRIEPRRGDGAPLSVSQIRRADAGGDPADEMPPSIVADDGLIVLDEDYETVDAAAVGTLVHGVLERVNFAEPGRLEPLVDAGMATLIDSGDTEIREAALGRLQRLLDSALPAELAGARRIFRELDFLLRWPIGLASAASDSQAGSRGEPVDSPRRQAGTRGRASARAVQRSLFDEDRTAAEHQTPSPDSVKSATISGQIDCLYQTAAGTWRIIDYKTGRLPAGGVEAVKKEYELQVALYALAARELIGALPERVELVLVQRDIRRVPIELSDRFLAQASRRIDAALAAARGL